MRVSVRILGIDPGSQTTGFGIIDFSGQQSSCVTQGRIQTRATMFSDRLREIFEQVEHLVSTYQPEEIAVERVFVHRNVDSAIKLGHARAAALCATFGAKLPVYEYAPREIKQAVVGLGGARKEQVQHMVRALLSLAEAPATDAADALAVAICHAHVHRTRVLLERAAVRDEQTGVMGS